MTSIRNLDPPMQFAPFPAGFPLTKESPRILADTGVTDRSLRRAKVRELSEQEPRYETGAPPFPSGFPLSSGRDIVPRTPGSGLARIERKFLYEKLDPDIEIAPSGFPEPIATPRRPTESYAPMTPEQVATSRDYLSQIAEKEARERLQRATPRVEKAIQPAPVVQEIKAEVETWWKKTQSALAEAEREGYIVQVKLEEAAEKAALSDKAKFEADEARKLAEEASSQAKNAPSQARLRVAQLKEALADAKAQVLEEIRELQAAEADLEKAAYDKDNKAQEAKVVAKAAKAKRAELQELERMLARIEALRQETADAERRAEQVSEEMKDLVATLNRKQKSLEDKSAELDTLRKQVNDLAQQYAAAVSEHETSGAVVQRNVKVAEALREEAEHKLREAERLAKEWEQAKKDAEAAAQREREILDKVREIGEQEGEHVVQDVTRRLPTPRIKEAPEVNIYWSQGGEEGEPSKPELTPRPLKDIESD